MGVALSVALIFPLVPSDDMSNFMIKSENQPSCCTEHTHHGAVGSKKIRWQMPSESLNFALNSLRVGQVQSNYTTGWNPCFPSSGFTINWFRNLKDKLVVLAMLLQACGLRSN